MRVEILGAPVDLGADRRGVDMGPSAIRYAGLRSGLESAGHEVVDLGNLPLLLADGQDVGSERAKYLGQIVRMAETISQGVEEVLKRAHFALVLGGDHSASLGVVSGAAHDHPVGLIWIDAHGDFNTPATTRSGNVHGMILAALAGYGDPAMVEIAGFAPIVPPSSIALVGVRQLDPGERDLLKGSSVHVFTMTDVDRRGMADVMQEALDSVVGGAGRLHVSLDLDVLDPVRAPGVGTPVPGGISYREGQLAMEMVAASGYLTSMDVVEVNPILDYHNQTAELAVELILSALGKRIL